MNKKYKHSKYIGCMAYMDPKDGFLIIQPNAQAYKLIHDNHIMAMINNVDHSYLYITYNGACTFRVLKKYSRIIK